MDDVKVTERLGDVLDLTLPFVDEEGQIVTLQNYVKNQRPLVVMMGYYECPKLCSLVLNGFFSAARSLTWNVGTQYDFVMVSVDPKEDHTLAANKKATYVRYYGRNGSEKGIHFLTGREESIRKFADALGFHYRYDERMKRPSCCAECSLSKGKITRYLGRLR
jgi:protein SCO1/2